ncbi:hypothetical protein [Streptomyces sp. SAS_275]|uniref:hypothetical protein n=1 Tax=Streptomyces sp. SAS_275 TaxID=3412746 RepID=UPI00403CEADC
MTDRLTVDTITSDQLDALYDDLDRYEEVQGDMNEKAIDLTRRAELAETAVARVRALHQPTGVVAAAEHGEPPDCAVCGPNRWPCPTYQATEPSAPAATEATETEGQS